MNWVLMILVGGTLQIDGNYDIAKFDSQYKCAEAERMFQNKISSGNAVCINIETKRLYDHYPFLGLTREERIARIKADFYLKLNRPR